MRVKQNKRVDVEFYRALHEKYPSTAHKQPKISLEKIKRESSTKDIKGYRQRLGNYTGKNLISAANIELVLIEARLSAMENKDFYRDMNRRYGIEPFYAAICYFMPMLKINEILDGFDKYDDSTYRGLDFHNNARLRPKYVTHKMYQRHIEYALENERSSEELSPYSGFIQDVIQRVDDRIENRHIVLEKRYTNYIPSKHRKIRNRLKVDKRIYFDMF